MKLPPLQGTLEQPGFFVFAAADAGYFDSYGIPLINSVLRNTGFGVHMHLYNPRPNQIEFCEKLQNVSVTWETFLPNQFDQAVQFWSQESLPEPYQARRNRMLGIKVVDRNLSMPENVSKWLIKTYYASMRFVRLAELVVEPTSFLCIDVDGLVRRPFVHKFSDDKDFYLHQKDKGGHLAGALLTNTSDRGWEFVQQLGRDIRIEIEQDNIFWFLDQWILDQLVERYNKGYLPISYIDWYMKPDSAIWSAKGKRKDLDVFLQELKKYR